MVKCLLRETKRNQDFCIDLFSRGDDGNVLY